MHVEFQRFGGLSPALMNRAPRYSAELTDADAEQVRALVPPNFDALAASPQRERVPDAFSYEIVIDDQGRSHRVTLREGAIPDSVRPLIDWLSHKAGL